MPDGSGAVFAEKDTRKTEILSDRTIIKDEFTSLSYEEFKSQSVTLLTRIKDSIGIPVFISQSLIIRVISPTSANNFAGKVILENLTKITQEQLAIFQRPLTGLGLRFVFPPTRENPNEFQVRIEPYFKDVHMFFIETIGRFFQPIQDISLLPQSMDSVYDFLNQKIFPFLGMFTTTNS